MIQTGFQSIFFIKYTMYFSDAKNRLYTKYKNKINTENELIIKSQETR